MISKTHHVNFLVKRGYDKPLIRLTDYKNPNDDTLITGRVFTDGIQWTATVEGHSFWYSIHTDYQEMFKFKTVKTVSVNNETSF
jgi:hypothetical protein